MEVEEKEISVFPFLELSGVGGYLSRKYVFVDANKFLELLLVYKLVFFGIFLEYLSSFSNILLDNLVDLFLVVITAAEIDQKLENSVSGRFQIVPRNYVALDSWVDWLHILILDLTEEQFLDVGYGVEAAVVGVGLSGELCYDIYTRSW